jgi:hypothetical protein
MAKKNFYDDLEIKSRDQKECEKLEAELELVLSERGKMEKESKSLDDKIWSAYMAAEREQACRNTDSIGPATDLYNSLIRQKLSYRDVYHKKLETLNSKLSAIVSPYKAEVVRLIDGALGKLSDLYIFEIPSSRMTATGKLAESAWRSEIKTFGEKFPVEMEIKYVMAMSNASGIVAYRDALVQGKMRIVKSSSLKQLRAFLEELERNLQGISLEAREARITQDDLEKLNPGSFTEVALVTQESVLKMKPEALPKTEIF